MQKFNLANRFGLAISFFFLSVFPSTAAWAQKTSGTATAQGPQQVIVANTAAQPVPVTVQKTQYYQASQVLSCSGPFTNVTFNVPSGKTLIVRNVNVFAGSYGAGDTYGAVMYPDDASTSFSGFSMQQVGGRFSSWGSNWALNQQTQMSATQVVHATISRDAQSFVPACTVTVSISGELI